MSQITVLWFTSRDKPFKVLRLRKGLVQFLLCAGCLLLLLSLALGVWGWRQQQQLRQNHKDLAELRMELDSSKRVFAEKLERREDRLQSLQQEVEQKDARLQDMQQDLLYARQQLEDVREMELKVRDYLGLEQKKTKPGSDHSHQGGFGGYQEQFGDIPEQPVPDFGAKNQEQTQLVSYSLSQQDSMQEVLEYLQQRQKELDHLPSILPVDSEEFWISGEYGRRSNPYTSKKEFHSALDIAAEWKTPLIAPAKGTVSKVGKNHVWGNYVRLDHGNGIRTAYGHLHSVKVEEGQEVQRRDVLGLMGSTGRSTGTHVHYKVLKDGDHVDPKKYVLDWESEALTLRY
ncbi:MAG: peptidoglycan DD-metalloendopeptidase family protein [Desulfohalobiaceae bacterium]